ncbi:MAG: Holliday junction branch migration protein RuvA, partial [Kiritimatiellae bacterium]|nr:Holliday junction branch migration protein RuvA [Kiritimatiellia bacterium]
MITYLNGILAEKNPAKVVVECCGVGYEALIPLSTYDRLPATGEKVKVFTYHSVREDDEILFAFSSLEERDMFTMVTSVSGVGPKTALAVLSGFTIGDLQLAISQGDAKRIAAVKGIGKKTAERIVVELKDKVNPIEALANSSAASSSEQRSVLRDAMLALTALGF